MLELESIKIMSGFFAVIGSAILAYRVKGMLRTLALVEKANEINVKQIMTDDGLKKLVFIQNTSAHVDRAQKTPLLIVGFLLIIASGVLQTTVLF